MSEQFESFRRDPKNYRYKFFYYCPNDPCVVLPKTGRMKGYGWTINFAHPSAKKISFLFVLVSLLPTLLVLAAVPFLLSFSLETATFVVAAVAIIPVLGIVLLSAYLSNRPM